MSKLLRAVLEDLTPRESAPRHFETVNDFMQYTHDRLRWHDGLMVPGCVYCNGDM